MSAHVPLDARYQAGFLFSERGKEQLKLAINLIQRNGGTQSRSEIDAKTVESYATDMQSGAVFPPITVFYDGSDYWLADGFHRVDAAGYIGINDIDADIREGTKRDAILYSVGANATHGLRRTNADKRRAVITLLQDEEWSKWSDNEIAKRCGVSQPFVGNVRKELGISYNGYKIASRDGKTYQVDTSNIGKKTCTRCGETFIGIFPYCEACRDELYPYICGVCGDRFSEDVWHCPSCDHHYDTDECGNCHNYTRDGRYIGPDYSKGDDEEWEEVVEETTEIQKNVSIFHEPAASIEWYTPQKYIEAARNVMGGIDIDPASNDNAQARIKAAEYFTIDDDGFNKDWKGRVWLNPPYGVENGKAVAGKWAAKLIQQFDAGIATEAILLVNAVIDSKWFNILWRFPICLTDHRIKFEVPAGAEYAASPVIGSAIVYIGPNISKFIQEFSQFGAVVTRLHVDKENNIFSEVEGSVAAKIN